MTLELERLIKGPGEYQLYGHLNKIPPQSIPAELSRKIYTGEGSRPFQMSEDFWHYLTGRFKVERREVYRQRSGFYEGDPSMVERGNNFLTILRMRSKPGNLNEREYYKVYVHTGSKRGSRRDYTSITDIGGYEEVDGVPKIHEDPVRNATLTFRLDSFRNLAWGVLVRYQGENPGSLILEGVERINQLILRKGLTMVRKVVDEDGN